MSAVSEGFKAFGLQVSNKDEIPMVTLTLPDGSARSFEGIPTGLTLAQDISEGLAKVSLAIKVNGQLQDLDQPIKHDASVELITRGKGTPEALEIIRHDCAHVLAEAVQALFPDTQVSIGPAIENGFYYDFFRLDGGTFNEADFPSIEAKMREIIAAGAPFQRKEVSRSEALVLFEAQNEPFKVELVQDLPEDEIITLYSQGEWTDLCRGPHAATTASVGKYFKLMSVAGAYWRGDVTRPQMQRIYGIAFEDKKQLNAHLTMLEEAAKRDHRKLGREMGLFHMQEEATGSVFWHPKGWTLYRTVEAYMRRRQQESGYQEVKTPQLVSRKLWEDSGHWEKFRENMFTTGDGDEDQDLALKPMNCPCHVQVFKQSLLSYRDLPLRMAEFGSCHRNESSGSMHGIMRVRAFTQDDGHIFCTPEQINVETETFIALLTSVYKDFGFEDIVVKFSDRPEKRAGSDAVWDRAEAALKEAIEIMDLPYEMNPGEGAFYGPKLEFVLKDAIGRDWQCGTLQVDFVLPERLNAHYIDNTSTRQRPVMLHRAVIGSFERFLGILIENFEGKFPLWLAPTQGVVATIVSAADNYAAEVQAKFRFAGLRFDLDIRNEKINFKVREHSLSKVPLIAVVGEREAKDGTIALRRLGSQRQEVLALEEAIEKLSAEATAPDLDDTKEKETTSLVPVNGS